jgi:hypothetical protein
MFAAEKEDAQADRVPKPTIAAPGSADHPQSYPAWRPPTVEPPHHAMIPAADEFQHRLWKHRHADISWIPSRYTVNGSKSFRGFLVRRFMHLHLTWPMLHSRDVREKHI